MKSRAKKNSLKNQNLELGFWIFEQFKKVFSVAKIVYAMRMKLNQAKVNNGSYVQNSLNHISDSKSWNLELRFLCFEFVQVFRLKRIVYALRRQLQRSKTAPKNLISGLAWQCWDNSITQSLAAAQQRFGVGDVDV